MDKEGNAGQPYDVRTNTMCYAEFSYSRHAVLSLLASLFLIVLSISYLIPPFQSPDEFNHLKRAYLLSQGDVFLHNKDNVTGGYIDSGLLDYMALFVDIPFNYDHRIYSNLLLSAKHVQWSGKRDFSGLPNTALYFPLPYIPQALAFIVGQNSRMTVSNTYYLARFFSLTATLTLLGCALLLYPAPLIVIVAFIIPMSLFQLASASLDSVSFAICVLAASLYMRGVDNKYSFNKFMLYALTVCVFALATSRCNLFLLTLLPGFIYINRRSSSYLLHSAIVFIVALAWIVYSTITVQGIPASELSTKGIVFYYLHHPIRFCDVIYATISNKPILISYWQTFVGILGWLDTPLGSDVYVAFAVLLCILAGVSFQRNTACLINWRKGLFIGVTIASGFLVFVVLLAGYTPHPAHVVACVVGRYFTTFFILLCYAIFDRRLSRIEFRLGLIIIFLMLCLSIAGMSSRLLTRYWLSSEVQIFQIRPNSPIDFDADAYYNLGVSYGKLGNYTQAISDFDRAIEINPEYADAYKGRGVAYGNLGNYTQAISDFDRAIEINPDYAMAYYDRGVVYEILGNNRQAISDFDRAIEINPEYAEAYNGRGLAYGKLGNNRQAISDFDRAIEINPDYAMAYHNRAVVYGILGNHMQEIEDLQKAARLGSKDAKK
jgi:uncharacterized membrane protein/Tfp pilus assembly protein PilF